MDLDPELVSALLAHAEAFSMTWPKSELTRALAVCEKEPEVTRLLGHDEWYSEKWLSNVVIYFCHDVPRFGVNLVKRKVFMYGSGR